MKYLILGFASSAFTIGIIKNDPIISLSAALIMANTALLINNNSKKEDEQ